MPNTMKHSASKRTLLAKYLRGMSRSMTDDIPRHASGSFAHLSFGQRQLCLLSHLLSDIPIYRVLLPELYTIYEALLNGRPSLLHEMPLQCADYAYWQQEWLQGDILTNRLNYWKTQLAGAPVTLQLPTDWPRQPVHSYRGSTRRFALSKSLPECLQTLSS